DPVRRPRAHLAGPLLRPVVSHLYIRQDTAHAWTTHRIHRHATVDAWPRRPAWRADGLPDRARLDISERDHAVRDARPRAGDHRRARDAAAPRPPCRGVERNGIRSSQTRRHLLRDGALAD